MRTATSRSKFSLADLRREFAEAHPDELLPRPVAAAGIGCSLSWLELAATKGGGPAFFKRGRRVVYRKADVLAWLAESSLHVRSTSEYAQRREHKSESAGEGSSNRGKPSRGSPARTSCYDGR